MKKIAVQGLGYVGLAMMSFCAGAKKKNKYIYNVVGIEKNSHKGLEIIENINSKKIPNIVDDSKFANFYSNLIKDQRIKVSLDHNEYNDADIVIICSNCDYNFKKGNVELKRYLQNINEITKRIKNNCLLVVQSTLPPGTTNKLLLPLIKKNLKKRRIKNFYLSHSFERVTPGKDYYFSMKNVDRTIGAINKESSIRTKKLFKNIFDLNTKRIIELATTMESETCKIIENSYRATNIAFIEEWRKFCLANNLNLEKILDCIRRRKSHSNIMRSGIGVGGYCLTKDPLFGNVSSKQILNKKHKFPLTLKSVEINKKMTFNIMSEIKKKFSQEIKNKKVLLIGVSYREDTNDTRHSSAEKVYNFLKKMKCKISFYDPFVNYWNYANSYSIKKGNLKNFDVYIHLIKHKLFKNLKIDYKKNSLILDLNNTLVGIKKKRIKENKSFKSYFIGTN